MAVTILGRIKITSRTPCPLFHILHSHTPCSRLHAPSVQPGPPSDSPVYIKGLPPVASALSGLPSCLGGEGKGISRRNPSDKTDTVKGATFDDWKPANHLKPRRAVLAMKPPPQLPLGHCPIKSTIDDRSSGKKDHLGSVYETHG